MFAVGDKVVHKRFGICSVSSIGVFNFPGQQNKTCFVLSPLPDDGYGTTYYVPVEHNGCLREPLLPEQILAMIDAMPETTTLEIKSSGNQIQDMNDTKTAYQTLMDSGSVSDRVILLKTIYKKSQQLSAKHKRISEFESYAREFGERMLYGEIASVMDIPFDQVERFITQRLEGNK